MSNYDSANEIRRLAKEKGAIILAHNYQRPEIQDVADFVGDSLGLSQKAAMAPNNIIIFCGVHFMAETASILCPDKKVIIPRPDAGCTMADMVTTENLAARKKELPGVPVVTYVNSTAAVKAISDICCTSANVVAVLKSLPEKKVLMVPDRNLAAYAQSQVPEKEVIYWDGCCCIHDNLTLEEVMSAKAEHPNAVLVVHPECDPEVVAIADAVRSTSGMLEYCRQSEAREFIIGTEQGVLHQLEKNNPDKKFYEPGAELICPTMKLTGINDVLKALQTLEPEVKVPENIRKPALLAVERMLNIPRD